MCHIHEQNIGDIRSLTEQEQITLVFPRNYDTNIGRRGYTSAMYFKPFMFKNYNLNFTHNWYFQDLKNVGINQIQKPKEDQNIF